MPWLRFSWLKTANRMRSIEVRSEKPPMGLVRRRTSRKRRSMALVVRTFLRSTRDLYRQQVRTRRGRCASRRRPLGSPPPTDRRSGARRSGPAAGSGRS
jgi:hypothetical protein